jgi:hypothetical protein
MTPDLDVRDLIMDLDEVQNALQCIKINHKNMEDATGQMFEVIENGLRLTWIGQSAVEFFFMYDRAFDGLEIQKRRLLETFEKFEKEIGEWIEMAKTLAT